MYTQLIIPNFVVMMKELAVIFGKKKSPDIFYI